MRDKLSDPRFRRKEFVIKRSCNSVGVRYVPPKRDEPASVTKSRRLRMNRLVNHKLQLFLYIHVMKDGPHNLTKNVTSRGGQLGDLSRIRKQYVIHPAAAFMYLTKGETCLRKSPHGSGRLSDLDEKNKSLFRRGIENIVITKEKAKGKVLQVGDLTIMYDDNDKVQDLHSDEFEESLISHFLANYKKIEDDGKGKNKNRDPHSTSICCRIDGGCRARYQPPSVEPARYYEGEIIPNINTRNFLKLPPKVLDYLFTKIFPAGQEFLDSTDEAVYNDPLRNRLFAEHINREVGYESSTARFEYYDILLTEVGTSLSTLIRHMDKQNDLRSGYDYSVVYSFYRVHEGTLYKCSIIMTTRTNCGAAMEKINKAK